MRPAAKLGWIGALAVLAAACSTGGVTGAPGEGAPTTTAASQAEAPVVIGLGGLGSPRTLNPLLDGPDTAALDLIGAATFASAFEVDPAGGELRPEVLFEVPTREGGGVVARPDGTLEVTYRVAPDARWADGEAITAADLRFTFEVATDPSLPIRRDVRAQYAAVVPGSVTVDGLTLRLVLRRGGDPRLLFGIILPEHQVVGTDFVTAWNDRMWVGGGPFTFAAWQPGQFLALRRNLYYWEQDPADGSPLPHLEELVYRFFPEPGGADVAAAFAARMIDVAALPAGTDLAPYRALEGDGAALLLDAGRAWQALLFQYGPANSNPDSLNGEIRFRQAVAAAVDRTALARERGTEPLPSIFHGCRPSPRGDLWGEVTADPERVGALLDALGRDLGRDLFAGDGPRLLVTVPMGDAAAVEAAETVANMLRAAGIAAEVQVEEASGFYGQTLPDGTWDAAVLTLACGPGISGAAALGELFGPAGPAGGGASLIGWGTPGSVTAGDASVGEYAELLGRLAVAGDEAAAVQLLAAAESLLAREVVLLPLVTTGQAAVAFWTDRVAGVAVNPAEGLAAGMALWIAAG